MLRAFDSILRPLIETIDSIDSYFDPDLAPAELLPWLAAWVGAEIDDRWPEEVRRALIKETVGLHRERGTAAGLRRALKIVTGQDVLVLENTAGLRLDEGARLGLNTELSDPQPHTIYVTIQGDAAGVDMEALHEVIRRMKPAHATYSVRTTEGQVP
jgi:phage tail-like protein